MPKLVIVGYAPYCLTACSPAPTAPPPQWSVSIKGITITFSAGGIQCNASPYVGYVIVELVDTAACATTSPSNKAQLLVNISNNC